jgi:DNA-binding response OmpR family regulator
MPTVIDATRPRQENAQTPSETSRTSSAQLKILIAEDDAPLAEFLDQKLRQQLFSVQTAANGLDAQKLAINQPVDLVILDLALEKTSGLDVLRAIRARKPDLPVILLTASTQLEDRIRGLDAGADDNLAKPFAFAELAARIRAVLRRGGRPGQSILQVEDLCLDRLTHSVQRGGRAIDLSPKEFALLEFLMMHRGQPVSRTAIVEQVWKLNFDTMTNVVDVYINYLRRKVDSGYDRALIRTVRGVGYQISAEAPQSHPQANAAH